MRQLSLFDPADKPTQALLSPFLRLKPETDPEWIQEALGSWHDRDALAAYLRDLERDVRDLQVRPLESLSAFDDSMLHDLRDSIRVVAERVRELA